MKSLVIFLLFFSSYLHSKPIVGSLGWGEKAFQAIKQNQLQFSLGGNHLNAMLALI